MELNTLEQGLATNRTIFEQSVEQPIDTEFTLPDYCPEIERILKCRVIPRISSKSQNGSSFTADGNASITLIYAGSAGEISSYDYQVPFSKTLDIGAAGTEPADAVFVTCDVMLDYATCRAITPRRINVHGAVMAKIKAQCRKNTNVIADIDDENVQMQKGTATTTVPMAQTEKQFSLEEEVEIPSDKAAVICMIRCSSTAVVNECKIVSSKAVVKGRLCIDALYKSENGCEKLKTEIPFSQVVDIPGADEDCSCSAKLEVCSFDMRPKTGMSGEARTFMVDARINVVVEAFCNREVSLIYDAYSTQHDTTVSKSDVSFDKYVYGTDETFICKKTLEFPEGSFNEIVDVWCDMGGNTVKSEGSSVVIAGELMVCILGRDPSGTAVFYERPAPYDYRVHLDKMPEGMKCVPVINVSGTDYSLMGSGKVEIRAELKISVTVIEVTKYSLLSRISVNEDSKKPTDDSALVIYFADKGEKVWDIARKYNTSPSEIASVNELSDDTLASGRILLIPRV